MRTGGHAIIFGFSGESEINDFDSESKRINENVLEVEVAMNNPLRMQIFESILNLLKNYVEIFISVCFVLDKIPESNGLKMFIDEEG